MSDIAECATLAGGLMFGGSDNDQYLFGLNEDIVISRGWSTVSSNNKGQKEVMRCALNLSNLILATDQVEIIEASHGNHHMQYSIAGRVVHMVLFCASRKIP